ncbi:MAG: cytosine permease [Verrucomicrobiae bacterium]|nr:cytosine permease [Verrucomicrobiae bacterium]
MKASGSPSDSRLPDYITSAKPTPVERRVPWYRSTAPAYAGIFLWFVFWQDVACAEAPGGTLSQGLPWALVCLGIAALACHFLFYLVPGLLGMKTGLPLYIVGTSIFGAQGGFILPGFLMGLLQFGWLGVNIYFSALAVSDLVPVNARFIMVLWGGLAAFIGLKGISYVAKVATYLPSIPFAVLIVLGAKTISGALQFDPTAVVAAQQAQAGLGPGPLSVFGVLGAVLTYVVGFFATAGAAGVDFGMNNRSARDVQLGGLVGIGLAAIYAGALSLVTVAGVYGSQSLCAAALAAGGSFRTLDLIPLVLGEAHGKWVKLVLAIAAFPPACFSAFIAANSFKTTLPRVSPVVSVGIGAGVSILLALSGWAGRAIIVFQVIGASFGPICGAMLVDYLLAGRRWDGPRAGFNPAGWVAWFAGFIVGILPILKVYTVPAAPMAAFLVGAAVYWGAAKAGWQSISIPHPGTHDDAAK